MASNTLDVAYLGLPFCYIISAQDAKTLDYAYLGLPFSTNVQDGGFYLMGGF